MSEIVITTSSRAASATTTVEILESPWKISSPKENPTPSFVATTVNLLEAPARVLSNPGSKTPPSVSPRFLLITTLDSEVPLLTALGLIPESNVLA